VDIDDDDDDDDDVEDNRRRIQTKMMLPMRLKLTMMIKNIEALPSCSGRTAVKRQQ